MTVTALKLPPRPERNGPADLAPDLAAVEAFLRDRLAEPTNGDWSLIADAEGDTCERFELICDHSLPDALRWIAETNGRGLKVELLHETDGSVGFFPIPGLIDWDAFDGANVVAFPRRRQP